MPTTDRLGAARQDWLHATGVAVLLFALYAFSAPRTVAMEDDGLFLLSSYFLGIEHPPGYPLFTLIGHLFTWLPFGSVAYRVHLASAFFGALAGAATWFCARVLTGQRLPSALASLGLGASTVFWSQAIIAEVYTLNAFFFLLLTRLGLRACPPGTRAQGVSGREQFKNLPWMALLFGLSLSNHYPLMLLVTPAFAVLLWPLREELVRRLGLYVLLVGLGLTPYLWMVYRSWMALPISFNGPLETLPEIWFFISRAGYAGIDQSVSADWVDRARFLTFFGEQLGVQFAFVGTLLAAIGLLVQWRVLGRRIGAFLVIAFLMSSVALIVLLGFDYSSVSKHVFHVYPLPAYAVAALWMALGFDWLRERFRLSRRAALAGATALLVLILAVGARANVSGDHEWMARYAQTVLKTLPRDAVVFGKGDPDLAPMGYLHMIEKVRPDITLYHAKGLVLGSRLFHPLRTDEQTAERLVREMIARQLAPVAFTLESFTGYAMRDRWLYMEIDRSSADPKKVTVDIPPEAVRFFEEDVADARSANAWVAFLQSELRRRYAVVLARSLPRDRPLDARSRGHLERLEKDFHGALGIAEGLMLNEQGYSVGRVASALDGARERMPSDVTKDHLSRYFYLRGAVRANLRDTAGAVADFETAFSVWPNPENPSLKPLEDLYRETRNDAALRALQDRLARLKRPRR